MADQLPGSGTDPLTGQPARAGLFIPAKSEPDQPARIQMAVVQKPGFDITQQVTCGLCPVSVTPAQRLA